MIQSPAPTVSSYLQSLSADRRSEIEIIRDLILRHLPTGYEEGMLYGMIGYYVPFSRYPQTYNGQPLCYVGLASQKNYISLYLTNIYGSTENKTWFETEYKKTGKKLNMGKSCLRFRKAEDIPLDLVGQAIARTSVDEFIKMDQAVHGSKTG